MAKWDFEHKSVQQTEGNPSGSQLGSKAVLISFGPPIKSKDAQFVVCGFVQNMTMNQQKRIQQLLEIGSGRKYRQR